MDEANLMHLFPNEKIQFNLPNDLERFQMINDETFNSCIEKFMEGSDVYSD